MESYFSCSSSCCRRVAILLTSPRFGPIVKKTGARELFRELCCRKVFFPWPWSATTTFCRCISNKVAVSKNELEKNAFEGSAALTKKKKKAKGRHSKCNKIAVASLKFWWLREWNCFYYYYYILLYHHLFNGHSWINDEISSSSFFVVAAISEKCQRLDALKYTFYGSSRDRERWIKFSSHFPSLVLDHWSQYPQLVDGRRRRGWLLRKGFFLPHFQSLGNNQSGGPLPLEGSLRRPKVFLLSVLLNVDLEDLKWHACW